MKEGFPEFFRSLLPRVMELPGEISVYGKDLSTDEKWAYEADIPLVAASVICGAFALITIIFFVRGAGW